MDKGKGALFGQPTAKDLQGKNFLDILRTSLVGEPGNAKKAAVDFVVANSKYYYPSMESLFHGDLKDKRVVIVTHAAPKFIHLFDGNITVDTDLTKEKPTWSDLTLIACDAGDANAIGKKLAKDLKKPVYAQEGRAIQKYGALTSFDEETTKKFAALLNKFAWGTSNPKEPQLNYFTFEQAWEKLFKESKKKEDDYAYWDANIKDWKTVFKDLSK